jgi:hypothetical protein
MAKNTKKPEKKADYSTMTEMAQDLIAKEYTPWHEELKLYWPGIDKMQDMWEFFKSEKEKSPSKISLNTGFAVVESMVAKANEINIKIGAEAHGINGLEEVADYVAAVTKSIIYDKDIAQIYSTFRKRAEMHVRDYFIKGTAFSEDQYCYKTQIIDGVKKVIADNPYTLPLDYKSVTFNPAYHADSSPVYWVEKHTTWKALKDNEYDEKTGKGLYVNLGALKENCDKSGKLVDHIDLKVIQDGKKRSRKVEPIQLLIRWDGCKMTIIADQNVIIRQATDPFKTGRNNLHISMNYKVIGRPYAYGELDPIYKSVRAQDTIVNQNIASINKYLEPGFTYDPNDISVNVDQIMDVLEFGGLAPAKKDSVTAITRVLPPNQAFQTIDELQLAIERTARYTGVSSQSTDMTRGTASTLQEVNKNAAPDFQTKLDDLQDSYYEPVCTTAFQMVVGLMGKDDVRRAKLMGKKPIWVEAAKNLLQGKLNVEALYKAKVIDEKAYQEYIAEPVIDPMTGQPAVDPQTGEPVATANPELAKTQLFDVDWLITVTLDNQAEQDKAEKVKKKQEWFMQAQQMGLPVDAKKFMLDMAQEIDIEDPDQYLKDEVTVQQEQEQMSQERQGQMQQEQEQGMQQEQMKHQMNMEAKQADVQAKQQMTQAQIEAQMQMAQMKQQPPQM